MKCSQVIYTKIDAVGFVKIILEFPEFKTFEELHRWSLNNHEQFWARMSKSMISWDKEFTVTGKNFTVDVALVVPVKTARIWKDSFLTFSTSSSSEP